MNELRAKWDHFWPGWDVSARRPSWSKLRIMRILDRYIAPDAAVLDAGCGSGFFSWYFNSRRCAVTTLDYSPAALEKARTLTEGKSREYLSADLTDPAFAASRAGTFDLIFTDGLFEHFDQPTQHRIMDNFVTMKRSGGCIATFVPNRFSPWQLLRPFILRGIPERPFTGPRLRDIHHDLAVIESGGLNVLPVALSPEFLGSQLGMLLYIIAR